MATTMLNVRLDKTLKSEGDRVLAKQGISTTEAVRGLYRFMEKTREVPDFCMAESGAATPESRRSKMRKLVGIVKLEPKEDADTVKRERLSRLAL